MVGLAIVLNFLKIPLGPSGGSINLQMLPLFLYSLRKGVFKGFIISGIVFGGTTFLSDSYGNIASLPFDYIVGFGGCAVLGCFSFLLKKDFGWKTIFFLVIGGVIATAIRFIGSTLSSIIVYKFNLVAALSYNALYIPISGAAATLLLCLIYKPLSKIA